MMNGRCPSAAVGAFAGTHMLAELGGVDGRLLDDEALLCRTLRAALKHANATVLDVVSKQFEPQGVTVIALLSESHASVHTYPEFGTLFVDVFTCGDRARPADAVDYLADALHAASAHTNLIARGHAVELAALGVSA